MKIGSISKLCSNSFKRKLEFEVEQEGRIIDI